MDAISHGMGEGRETLSWTHWLYVEVDVEFCSAGIGMHVFSSVLREYPWPVGSVARSPAMPAPINQPAPPLISRPGALGRRRGDL